MQPSEHMADRYFRSIAELIETRVGIQLPDAKRTMVEGRLRKRVRALDLDDLDSYGSLLFDQGHLAGELTHLIDCVTTNKTDFFREPDHFALLRDRLVPGIVARQGRGGRRLKVWSAAASTGAEAYTIAMVLHDMGQRGSPLPFAILGTDISTEVLAVASRGIYSSEMLQAVPEAMRRRYVMLAREDGRSEGRIVPELRRHVRFQRLNLMDRQYPIDDDVDIVFCRNVLIYFDKPTQKGVIAHLGQHLRPGGYLVVGHSESMAGIGVAGLTQVAPTVFQTRA